MSSSSAPSTGSSSAVLGRAALPSPALTETLEPLLGALPDALDALVGAAADSGDALSGPSADVLNGALGALAGGPDDVAGVGEQIVGSTTDVTQGLADALEQLRVTVEGGEDTGEDLRDIAEAGLQERLCLDALDVQLDLAEPDSGPRVDLHELPGLGEHGEVGAQIVQLELDLVDLDDGCVDVDIDRLVDLARIDDRIVGQVLLGPLGAR
jgi:hypothetical protein